MTNANANADVETTWRALLDLDLLDVHSPLLNAAFFARGVPAKLAALRGRTKPSEVPAELGLGGADERVLEGWLSLGQIENRETALGAVGPFWRPNIEYDVTKMTPDEFAEFEDPGCAGSRRASRCGLTERAARCSRTRRAQLRTTTRQRGSPGTGAWSARSTAT